MRVLMQVVVSGLAFGGVAYAGPQLAHVGNAQLSYETSAHLIQSASHEPAMVAQHASSDRALLGGLVHYRQNAKVIDWRGPLLGNATYVQGTRELDVGSLHVPLPVMTSDNTRSFVAAVRLATK